MQVISITQQLGRDRQAMAESVVMR